MTDQQEPAYASAAAVAGLAREVEALRRSIDQLGGLAGRVEELAGLVTRLAESTAALAGGRASAGGPPSWLDLPASVADCRRVLEELVAWMSSVYLRYADAAATLPECWLWHPEVIEELCWLMRAWLAAYRDDDGSVAAAGDWHDRYRPGVVRRINSAHGRCSLENHQPRDGRHVPAGPVVPLRSAAADIARWWAGQRDGPAPVPTADHLADAAGYAHRGRVGSVGSRGRS